MKKTITLLCSFLFTFVCHAQVSYQIRGSILDSDTKTPIRNALISVQSTSILERSDTGGFFTIKKAPLGKQILVITSKNYKSIYLNVVITNNELIDLGVIRLQYDYSFEEQSSGLISLTEDDLNDDDIRAENTTGLLQASRDIFQKKAAFDFGQAFFRVRGYDAKYAMVLINGLSMNRLFNGRPQWNNWGGLNDVTRNQEFTSGLLPFNYAYGGILGNTNISTRASEYRPGYRVSSSFSNRTYTGRGMFTYSSGLKRNGIAYTFSASRRWGNQGYINGSFYDAYSIFGAFELKLNQKNSLNITAIFAPNKRGATAAITERVFNALGRQYNPYWGFQENVKRNSRVRAIEEPLFMFSHFFESERINLTTNFFYQTGKQGRSRLDFANAPNPNPNYWRYLPNITAKPQIDWSNLYQSNLNIENVLKPRASRYLLYEDRTDTESIAVNTILNAQLTPFLFFDIGGTYRKLDAQNFANILDLLGAAYYEDVNPFTIINGQPSRNDLNGAISKEPGDRIKYNYSILSSQINGFAQLRFNLNKADFFVSGTFTNTSYQREGHFLNETYLNNSLGKSEKLVFSNLGLKGGLTYKFSGKHLLNVSSSWVSQPPTIRNSFINSRENNDIVSGLESEQVFALEAFYMFRSSQLKAKLSSYLTRFQGGNDLNFVFAQIGSGTDFFQEVITNIDKKHLGFELGVEYNITPKTKILAVAAYGNHSYTDNPNVRINFDSSGFNNDLINSTGFKDLGKSNIKGLRVANGPQQAYAIGVEYRDPKYWWIGATANYLLDAYVDVSTITRTGDFFINPDDPLGLPFEDIDMDLASKLLQQERFNDFYLLNLTGGKSWRIKNNYLSLFISINNLFETTFKTGGYEQSRAANYGDLIEDTSGGVNQRNFGNKYWFGFGRTYFINLAYNF